MTTPRPAMKKHLIASSRWFLDTLLPHRCLFCDQLSHNRSNLCDVCAAELEPNLAACPRCALPHTGGALCPECQTLGPHAALERIVAPWVYDESLAFLMQRWKYTGERHLAQLAATLMLSADLTPADYDLVLATPLHWRRFLVRGFNQADDLRHALQRRLPGLQPLHQRERARLLRRHATDKQALASRDQRARNMRRAFALRGDVRDQRILLIDDICTTGATAAAMATTLKDAGADSVSLWCLARTPKR